MLRVLGASFCLGFCRPTPARPAACAAEKPGSGMAATPTGTSPDPFMERLALAERRDANRPPSARPPSAKATKRATKLRFHPNVVTGSVIAPDVERTCCEHGVSMYTPREEQEALQRMMIKQHLRECSARADPETQHAL